MKRWGRVWIVILLAVVLAIGFTLPTGIARFQDTRTDQTHETVAATPIQLDMESALTVLQKLRILTDSSAPVEIDYAQNMDAEQALDRLTEGLRELFAFDENGIFHPVSGFSEVSHTINLKMTDTDSLIYWEFWLVDGDGNQISAAMDDDTGLILSLRYTLNMSSHEESFAMPGTPLYLIGELPEDTISVFYKNGIFGLLEGAGSSAEIFAGMLQEQYCGSYLREHGYRYGWDIDTSEPVDDSYLFSVMVVDDAGGYYVLPFTISNNEVSIN